MITDLNTDINICFTSSPTQLEARELSAELALILCAWCLSLTTECFISLASLKVSPDVFTSEFL